MLHDMLLVEVKQPTEITKAGDYLKVLGRVPAEQAFRSPHKSGCPLVQ